MWKALGVLGVSELLKATLWLSIATLKFLGKDIQTKNNVILALRPYVTGELMITKAETTPKQSQKSKPEHKKYKKWPKTDDDELEVLEFMEEEESDQQVDFVPPGA